MNRHRPDAVLRNRVIMLAVVGIYVLAQDAMITLRLLVIQAKTMAIIMALLLAIGIGIVPWLFREIVAAHAAYVADMYERRLPLEQAREREALGEGVDGGLVAAPVTAAEQTLPLPCCAQFDEVRAEEGMTEPC
jgi:hypothetical protein